MGKIIRNGIEYSGTYDSAISVNYDNSVSGLNARTVQEGIDQLNESLKGVISFNDSQLIGYQPYGSGAMRVVIPYFNNNPILNITNAVFYHPTNGWVPLTLETTNNGIELSGNLLTIYLNKRSEDTTVQGDTYIVKLTGTVS